MSETIALPPRALRLPRIRWSMVRALYVCRYLPLLLTTATPHATPAAAVQLAAIVSTEGAPQSRL